MGPDGNHVIDPSVYQRNLLALREVEPTLAASIERYSIDERARSVQGRDGKPTYQVVDAERAWHWFGGSSAVSVSAPSLMKSFDAGSGNVLLYGIGSGAEAKLLLARLETHRGVLIAEEELLYLALALRLHDYSAELASRRVAFIFGPLNQLGTSLSNFLLANEGYLITERVMRWPWLTDEQVQQLQRDIEYAAGKASSARAAAMNEVQEQWRKLKPNPQADVPRVAVITPRANPYYWYWASRIEAAGRELGWTVKSFLVCGPMQCHPVYYARRVQQFAPDWVIALDVWRNELQSFLPTGIPVLNWIESASDLTPKILETHVQTDAVAVVDRVTADVLQDKGCGGDRVGIIPHGAWNLPLLPAESERVYDVIVLADAGPVAPDSFGVTLHTHQSLWRESVSVVRRELDSYLDDRAEQVLRQAERNLKAEIRESGVRESMIRAIRDITGPRTIVAETVAGLCKAGIRVHVWGAGWEETLKSENLVCHGAIPGPAAAGDLLCKGKIYLVAGTHGRIDPAVLMAAAGGAVIIWRRHPRDGQPGGVNSLFHEKDEYQSYRSVSELVASCRSLLKNQSRRNAISASARKRVEMEHALGSRLVRLRDTIRGVA